MGDTKPDPCTRWFLGDHMPSDLEVRGWRMRLRYIWRVLWGHPAVRLDVLMRYVQDVDAHNHRVCGRHIRTIDNIHTWLGENIKPNMQVSEMSRIAQQIHNAWTLPDTKWPWEEES